MKRAKIIVELQKHKKIIAKSRDAMRDILSDIENDLESFDRGVDDLESAIQSISEVV